MAISREIMIASEKTALSLGYSSLKPVQKEVITAFLKGNDVFGVLPMGYGKASASLAFPVLLIFHTQRNQDITGKSYKSSKSF